YLYQTTLADCLFGWFYNDAMDEFGRNVPYFICYYYSGQQHSVPLDKIFSCLHKGPVAWLDRKYAPASLEPIIVPSTLSYQPVRKGVAIPVNVRLQCDLALQQKHLLNISTSAVAHQGSTPLQVNPNPTRSRTPILRETKLTTYNSHIVIVEVQGWIEVIQAIRALKQCKTVILKLHWLEPVFVQRITDFVRGGIFSIDGHAERLNDQTLLLLPKAVANNLGTHNNSGYMHRSAS
ncbi:MAG: cell division protein SepF, partial [Cyanobacteria bacterium P01_A01_bin.17]